MQEFNSFENLCLEILNLVKKERLDFVQIGFLLEDLNNKEYINTVYAYNLGRNCKSIYELAQEKFNLKRTTTKRLIAISKKFGERKGFICELQKNYIEFNYSQLVEMLPLSDLQLTKIYPDMSVAEIREFKKKSGEQKTILEYDPNQFYDEAFFKNFSKPELICVIMQLQERLQGQLVKETGEG